MLRHKQSSRQQYIPSYSVSFEKHRKSNLENNLLDFLDHFDVCQFITDDDYRKRLRDLLELFTDEEFDEFERSHINRFVMN